MTKKYDEFVFKMAFVGFAIICCAAALLISMEIWEPLDNVAISSILLSISAYCVLDYYTKIKKIKSRDKDEIENEA